MTDRSASGQAKSAGSEALVTRPCATIFKIAEVSRHISVDVLSGYMRRVDLFKDHAEAAFL
jgi:hypothetical protein